MIKTPIECYFSAEYDTSEYFLNGCDKQIENHYYGKGTKNFYHLLSAKKSYSALDIALACALTRLSYSTRFWQ